MYFALMLSASLPYRIIEPALFCWDSEDNMSLMADMKREERGDLFSS